MGHHNENQWDNFGRCSSQTFDTTMQAADTGPTPDNTNTHWKLLQLKQHAPSCDALESVQILLQLILVSKMCFALCDLFFKSCTQRWPVMLCDWWSGEAPACSAIKGLCLWLPCDSLDANTHTITRVNTRDKDNFNVNRKNERKKKTAAWIHRKICHNVNWFRICDLSFHFYFILFLDEHSDWWVSGFTQCRLQQNKESGTGCPSQRKLIPWTEAETFDLSNLSGSSEDHLFLVSQGGEGGGGVVRRQGKQEKVQAEVS